MLPSINKFGDSQMSLGKQDFTYPGEVTRHSSSSWHVKSADHFWLSEVYIVKQHLKIAFERFDANSKRNANSLTPDVESPFK